MSLEGEMRVPHRSFLFILTLGAGATLAAGQTMLEHGVIDARSAAAAAGAGTSLVTIFGKTNKALEPVKPPGPSKRVTPPPEPEPVKTAENLAPPVPSVADFTAVTVGMDRADLIKLVGKPSMSVSGVESSLLVETYWYRVGSETVTIILRGGKIASISGVEKLTAKK